MCDPPLVPATAAYAAAYAEDCAVCNSCKMQGAPKLKGAGRAREVSGGCVLAVLLQLRAVVALFKKRREGAGGAWRLVGPFAA